MRNPIAAVKQKIDENKTSIAFVAGAASMAVTTVVVYKKLPVKPFHHEFWPTQTAAEISEILDRTKAIDITCPHGVVTLFASDYTE